MVATVIFITNQARRQYYFFTDKKFLYEKLKSKYEKFNSGGPDGGSIDRTLPDIDGNNIPPSEAWQYDPEYWTDYRYGEDGRWVKKSESDQEDKEVCEIIDQEQNKGKIDDLPESCSGKYIFDISKKSIRF